MDFILRVEQVKRVPGMGYCWEWQGAVRPNGYGVMGRNKKTYRVHRIAYALSKGIHPDNIESLVLHKCHNRKCCNPSHLYKGTHKDNAADCMNAGRFPVGSQTKQSKLTEQQVLDIKQSTKRNKDLADFYGVSRALICDIQKGRAWRHV